MIPKRVELENFLSFGSPAAEIVFDDKEPLWVVGGPNGVGKSAVFDAITYALFGCHRGGASDHESLVRHGTNGLRVVFEFEFNGADYRITRTHPFGTGRPTRRVETKKDGGWFAIDLQAASGKQDPVKRWSEQTLGIGLDAFTASVLLRQGKSDEILTAAGARRLEILKKIIGTDQYERLSERVHDAARDRKRTFDDLKVRRENAEEITAADLEKADADLTSKDEARKKANEARDKAAARVGQAKQWVKFDKEREELEKLLRQADERKVEAQAIRAEHQRFVELTTVAPVLRRILVLQDEAEKADLVSLRTEAERIEAALKAKQLSEEIARGEDFLAAVDEVAKFPADLAHQLAEADRKLMAARDAFADAGQTRAGQEALLAQAVARQKEFKTVGVGAKCSRCGLKVTAEHAEREKADIDAEVKKHSEAVGSATKQEEGAKNAKDEAEKERKHLGKLHEDWQAATRIFAERQRALTQPWTTSDVDEVRRLAAAKKSEFKQCETAAGDKARLDRARLATRQTEVRAVIRTEESKQAGREGEINSLLGGLSSDWRDFAVSADAKRLAALDTERQSLAAANIEERFKRLQEDAIRYASWVEQRDKIARQIEDEIPEDARITAAEAERQSDEAKHEASDADTQWQTSRDRVAELTRQASEFTKLLGEIEIAEKDHARHHKLDKLLGKDGLQREMVREAERAIVRYAHDTVQQLSGGDLTIELDDAESGDDKAFSLRFRRADNPIPIGVDYLSGSQRFRVAIAVALAIGRYATGRARPLESVIIDEGFGSLDKAGLHATAEELLRLREHLRRIILVSHQEDFADRFPVVIKLSPGADGTIAEAVRR